MIYGRPRLVTDPGEWLAGLRCITEHVAPGQWDYARRAARNWPRSGCWRCRWRGLGEDPHRPARRRRRPGRRWAGGPGSCRWPPPDSSPSRPGAAAWHPRSRIHQRPCRHLPARRPPGMAQLALADWVKLARVGCPRRRVQPGGSGVERASGHCGAGWARCHWLLMAFWMICRRFGLIAVRCPGQGHRARGARGRVGLASKRCRLLPR